MKRLFLHFLLVLLAAYPLAAQQVIERQEKLAAGQRVFLNLRPADHIRVRAGQPGAMSFKATVSINQNKLNEAFVLDVSRTGDELLVKADIDREKLRTTPPGDCPDGQGSYWGESWTNDDGRAAGQRRHGICVAIDYEVAVPPGTELRISTISGSISLMGLRGAIQAKSISGDVDLSWPPAQQADLALKTISGEVYADPAVALLNRRERPIVGYEVRGTWRGGGGPAVRLESISGNVYFRQQP
ncbi:hypothetical protein [uncultured Hymenobacter sp.]|uniref:hypothetical protein n=1 Tax=uncultured Hymenobacter sp. TaxID=170016 RepID=UPI0035C943C6